MLQKYTIKIDTREQYYWDFPEDKYCEGSIFEKVDTGDYTIKGLEHLLTIERKATVCELANNITQDRFFREMDRMRPLKFKFLVLEFEMSDVFQFPNVECMPKHIRKKSRIGGKFIMQKLNDIQIDYGVSVNFAGAYGLEFATSIFKKVMKYVKDESNRQTEDNSLIT